MRGALPRSPQCRPTSCERLLLQLEEREDGRVVLEPDVGAVARLGACARRLPVLNELPGRPVIPQARATGRNEVDQVLRPGSRTVQLLLLELLDEVAAPELERIEIQLCSNLVQQALILIAVGSLGILLWITYRFRDVTNNYSMPNDATSGFDPPYGAGINFYLRAASNVTVTVLNCCSWVSFASVQ